MTSHNYLTIVTGLPRSGTSMMMRMLAEGGLEAMTDEVRRADDDNPRGYFEFEPVKRTKDDPSWVPGSMGKSVKMVYSLVKDMPAGFEYRLLLMRRTMSEILASQRKMLKRHDVDDDVDDAVMGALFEKQLADFIAWTGKQANIQMLQVSYNRMVAEPAVVVAEIDQLLGGRLDQNRMVAVIDPSLYRNRA